MNVTTKAVAILSTSVLIALGGMMLISHKLKGLRDPLKAWRSLNYPIVHKFRPFLYSYLISFVSPYSGSINMRVVTLDKGFCSGVLKEKRKVHNPFNSIHAAALCTFAETVGGLAVISTFNENMKGIVTKISIDYQKKARGLITATCNFKMREGESKIGEQEVEVILKDEKLDTVAKANITWQINYK